MTRSGSSCSQFRIDFDYDVGTVLISLHGELDALSVPAFGGVLRALAERGTRSVTIDLSELRFCNVGGLRVMAELAAQFNATDRRVEIRSPAILTRMLEISELDSLFVIVDADAEVGANVNPSIERNLVPRSARAALGRVVRAWDRGTGCRRGRRLGAVRSAGIASSNAEPGASGFRHEALLYSSEDEFIEQTTSFIVEGLARDEAVLTVVDAAKLAAIRATLNGATLDGGADRAFFADMAQVGRNPALIIQAWLDFVALHGANGRPVRGIGEPITAARDDAARTECHIHESLLNVAFADDPDFWLLCPYDTGSLPDGVVDYAIGTHPLVCDRTGHRLGDPHRASTDAGFAWPLPGPDTDAEVESFAFDLNALAALRRFVENRAIALGARRERVSELTVAVSEIATNAIMHGHGGGTARIWAEGSQVVCEVSGPGRITDPLIGRLRPDRGQLHGHGLWLANQFCDLVQIRSTDQGTTVRLHVSAEDRLTPATSE